MISLQTKTKTNYLAIRLLSQSQTRVKPKPKLKSNYLSTFDAYLKTALMIATLFSGQEANFLIALLYHQTLKEDFKRCTAIKEELISLELKGFSIYLWQVTLLQNQKQCTKWDYTFTFGVVC